MPEAPRQISVRSVRKVSLLWSQRWLHRTSTLASDEGSKFNLGGIQSNVVSDVAGEEVLCTFKEYEALVEVIQAPIKGLPRMQAS